MVRTSVSPNMITGGYRSNVIPSEAKARLDVRMVPGENPDALLEQIKSAINDPAVDVQFAGEQRAGPPIPPDADGFRPLPTVEAAVQGVPRVQTVPWMSTYATDMRGLRARGMQCVGIGPESTSRIRRADTGCTATRSACWKASSSGSCGSTGRSSARSHARHSDAASSLGGRSSVLRLQRRRPGARPR